MNVDDAAKRLTKDLVDFHEKELRGNDAVVKEAIIVKIVSLIALAYDIPPTSTDERVNYAEVLGKLDSALEDLGCFTR